MYFEKIKAEEAKRLVETGQAETKAGNGDVWSVEFHAPECPRAEGGWWIVRRNSQGERWTGAPWEKCWDCIRDGR